MSLDKATNDAARAVRTFVAKATGQAVQLADYGIVAQVNPLVVEMAHRRDVLDSDELVLTQEVRQYDKDVGLAAGDSLAMVPLESGEMLAVGVLSDKPLQAGLAAVATKEYVQQAIAEATAAAGVLPGTILPTGRTSAPAGYLMCDGSPVARLTYPALFAAIGTAFNTGGEAGTDFRLPNLIGRTPIGAGLGNAPHATTRTLGAYSGDESHTLVTAELPAHDHSPTTGVTGSTTPGVTGTPSTNVTGSTTPGVTGSSTVTGTTDSRHVVLPVAYGGGTGTNPGDLLVNAQWASAAGTSVTGYNGTQTDHTHTFTAEGPHTHTSAAHTHDLQNHTHTSAAHTHPLASVGSGTAFSMMTPTVAVNFVVKT